MSYSGREGYQIYPGQCDGLLDKISLDLLGGKNQNAKSEKPTANYEKKSRHTSYNLMKITGRVVIYARHRIE
jgi:hypothetical protein